MTSWHPDQPQHPHPEELLQRIHDQPPRRTRDDIRDFLLVFTVGLLVTLALLLIAGWRGA